MAFALLGVACGGGVNELGVREPPGSAGATSMAGNTSAAGSSNVSADAGSAGTAGTDDAPSAPVWEETWNVHASVASLEAGSGFPSECDELSFVLGFAQNGGALSAVVGRDGYGGLIALQSPAADGSVSMASIGKGLPTQLPSEADCWSVSALLQHLTLSRAGDRLRGFADGSLEFDGGDYSASRRVTYELTGTIDHQDPELDVPLGPVNPLDRVVLSVSEPLLPTELSLQGPSNVALLGPASGAYTAWSNPVTLPFGGTWKVTGSASDLAGHPLEVGQTVTTLPDPGVFAQDGFEGAFLPRLERGAYLVDAVDGYPVPTGERALLVPFETTLHLRREHEEKELVFDLVELLGPSRSSGASLDGVQVAVVGGKLASYVDWTTSDGTATTLAAWPQASAKLEVRVSLDSEGEDVAVRFRSSRYQDNALIIDNLRLE